MRLFSIFIAITVNTAAMTHFAAAQELMPVATTQTELPACHADAKKALRAMCMSVGSRTPWIEAYDGYKYMYQKQIFEAACVDPINDSDELIAAKVSRVWAQHEKNLVCSGVQFDVQKGNLLKFAVNADFNHFISDAIRWKINLNKIDDVDGHTVLDYIKDQIPKNKGNSFEPTLKRYYQDLRKAGAKHANEL